MNRNDPKFKELQAEWYKKLKQSGFEDLEQPDGRLKSWSSEIGKQKHRVGYHIRVEYYRAAGQFLHDHQFESEIEKAIWQKHSEGQSIRTIVKSLRRWHLPPKRGKINAILRRLRHTMLAKWRQKRDSESATPSPVTSHSS